MEITLAKIEAAEADVARLVAEEARMRKEAMTDGTIDPKEQADLDRILGKITQGRDVVARLRAEYEANKAIWDGMAGDLARLQSQTSELTTWGDPAAASLAAAIDAMGAQAGAEQWKAATSALQAALSEILAPYAEYQAQSAAKAIYDPARGAFDARLSDAAATDLRTPGIVAALGGLDGAGPGMDQAASARDFVSANEMLAEASTKLDTIEADIETLSQARDAYLSARGDLDGRMAQLSAGDFTTLAQRQADLVAKVTQIDALATAFDFVAAQTATTEATTEAEALQLEAETLRLARDGYEALRTGIEARIDAANAEGVVELAPKLEAITAKVDATKPLADAEDFAGASAGLEEAATEMGGFEELLAARKLYLERLADVMPKVVERGVSTEHTGFLQEPVARMAEAQTAMEAAAAALDFETALTELDAVVAALDAIEAAIEARRQEYQTERAILAGRLDVCAQAPYPEIAARPNALATDLDTADSEAAAEHFDVAMDQLAAVSGELDLLEQDIAKIETDLKDKIEKIIGPVEKKLPDLEEPPSPSLPALKTEVAGVRSKMASNTDLLKAVTEAEHAAAKVAELEKVHTIMARVEEKWSINQDNAARDIVAEMKASGDLNGLPIEARNYLVEKMMSGIVTDGDHAAIQDLWSQKKFVDPDFNELDAPIRKQIIDTFKNDPKVKQYEADWPTMTEDQKMEAVKHMTAIPCGPDGWNVGLPKDFKLFSDPASGGSVLLGDYSSGSDRMRINTHPDAEALGFKKLVDTIAHEIGHKQQAVLIKGYKDGSIKPGDPSYNQAKALQLCEDYRNDHNDEFNKIYESSPEESHSRTMGDEIRAALNAPAGGAGGHGP